MVQSTSFPRNLNILLLALVVSACGTGRDAPATAADAPDVRGSAPEQARQASGLSHLPRPANLAAFNRSLERHYPREFVGVRPSTSVLVDVAIDANGIVKNVSVVDRPAATGTNAVLIDRAPGSTTEVLREAPTVYDTRFGPAAAAALKEARFHPARRNGEPVPYTLRMTVEFTSPAS